MWETEDKSFGELQMKIPSKDVRCKDCFDDNISCLVANEMPIDKPPKVDLVANEVGVVRAVDEVVRQGLAHVL